MISSTSHRRHRAQSPDRFSSLCNRAPSSRRSSGVSCWSAVSTAAGLTVKVTDGVTPLLTPRFDSELKSAAAALRTAHAGSSAASAISRGAFGTAGAVRVSVLDAVVETRVASPDGRTNHAADTTATTIAQKAATCTHGANAAPTRGARPPLHPPRRRCGRERRNDPRRVERARGRRPSTPLEASTRVDRRRRDTDRTSRDARCAPASASSRRRRRVQRQRDASSLFSHVVLEQLL
jgi:hypothetical protein